MGDITVYISKKNHILTDALIQTAAVNFAEALIMGVVRIVLGKLIIGSPDMLNRDIGVSGNIVAGIRIFLTFLVFVNAYGRLNRARAVVSKDDYLEMAKLQEEFNPGGVSILSSYSTFQLLQIWGFVLVGMSLLQEMGGAMYQRFITMLSLSTLDMASADFIAIYNVTHGFKYMGMTMAIIIAIFATGIFIKDRNLKVVALVLMGAFVLAFAVMQMNTITLAGRTMGIVWTSVIFHALQTIGLLSIALYLRNK